MTRPARRAAAQCVRAGMIVPAALLVATLLGGCGGAEPVPPAGVAAAADCLADQALALLPVGASSTGRTVPAAGSVPDGFTPVAVVECRARALAVAPAPAPTFLEEAPQQAPALETGPEDPPPLGSDPTPAERSGSESGTVDEVRLDGDLEPLLRALSRPSDLATADQVCPAMMEFKPVLFLVDASGRAVLVRWPTTACGFTQPGAVASLEELVEVGRTTRTAS